MPWIKYVVFPCPILDNTNIADKYSGFHECELHFSRFSPLIFYVFYVVSQGEAYYKKLGYKSLMEGVVGEAEKEGT